MGKPIDHRVDIYSLGVLMYEMLTHELPFLGDDPDALLLQHINSPPPPLVLCSETDSIPDDLAGLVMQCLSKKPEERPNDMDEVITALAAIQF